MRRAPRRRQSCAMSPPRRRILKVLAFLLALALAFGSILTILYDNAGGGRRDVDWGGELGR